MFIAIDRDIGNYETWYVLHVREFPRERAADARDSLSQILHRADVRES